MKQLHSRPNSKHHPIKTLLLLAFTTLGCVFGINLYMSALEAQIAAKGHFVTVATAARDLDPGDVLENRDLSSTQLPATVQLDGGYPYEERQELIGKRVTVFMQKGDQITNAKVGEVLLAPSANGKRWYLLGDPSMAGSNVLKPGDKVDIIGVVGTPDGALQSSTIGQNITVASLVSKSSELYNLNESANGVILEVTLDQAQRIALAEELGSITLVKRAQNDSGPEQVHSVTETDLTASPQKAVYQRFELISGTKSEIQYIPHLGGDNR